MFFFLNLILRLASLIFPLSLLLGLDIVFYLLMLGRGNVPWLGQYFLLESGCLCPSACFFIRRCDKGNSFQFQLLCASKLRYGAFGFKDGSNVQGLLVYCNLKDAKPTDDFNIFNLCGRGSINGVLLCWQLPHNLQLDNRSASVIDGEDRILEVDVIDGYNNADYANISNRVVMIEVYALSCGCLSDSWVL